MCLLAYKADVAHWLVSRLTRGWPNDQMCKIAKVCRTFCSSGRSLEVKKGKSDEQ